MKIKDVIVSEATPKGNKGTAAGYKGTAGAQAIAQASGIKDVNQIKAGQTINIPGVGPYTVKPGDTLDKIAAANKVSAAAAAPAAPAAAAPAAADAAAPAAVPGGSDGTTQDIERLKKLAIGGDQSAAPAQDAMAGADAGDQTSSGYTAQSQAQKSPEPAAPEAPVNNQSSGYTAQSQAQKSPDVQQASSGYTGGSSTAQAPGGYAQSAVPNTSGQATQPDTEINPDTGLSTVAPQVKSGTPGVNWNIKTGSEDEMAWRAKNPNWNMTGAQYPGAGNWDPKTGRSKKAQAQADSNAAAVKGFFNKLNPFGKKEQPAAPAPSGQGTQPSAGPQTPGGYGRFTESELADIKKLSGLR